MRIFLTADFRSSIFSNGQNQNIFALNDLLIALGHEVFFIAENDPAKDEEFAYHKDLLKVYNIITIQEAVKKQIKCDIMLQAGITYGENLIGLLRKTSPSLKNVQICYGPRLFIDTEYCIKGSEGGMAGRHKGFDEIWISPHYDYSVDYYKIHYRTENVKFLPYIWSPAIMKEKEKTRNKEGETCFYEPSNEVNIAVMEPNNIVKNCVCPAMIAEGLHNEDPDIINSVYLWGTSDRADENYFSKFMLELDLVQDGKMFFEKRMFFPFVFSKYCNYMLSHQHMNALNYTYLECLYFGIPLIHNSEFIKHEAGYYYPGFELKKGVEALKRATVEHDNRLKEYKEEGERVIWKYSADNPAVRQGYEDIL